MIPEWSDLRLYELYNEFINRFLLEGKSFITEEDEIIFTKDNLNEVFTRYVKNYDESDKNYYQKTDLQFANASHEVRLIFAHANWLWAFAASDLKNAKSDAPKRSYSLNSNLELREGIIIDKGIGSTGRWFKNNHYWEVVYILYLFHIVLERREDLHSADDVKSLFIEITLNKAFVYPEFINVQVLQSRACTMYNIILHLSNPEKYETVLSQGHKYRICNSFVEILHNAPQEIKEASIDDKLIFLRKEVARILDNDEFSFYDEKIGLIWGWNGNYRLSSYEYTPLSALQYKQALILYGPPGTSKTYSAYELAQKVILYEYIRNGNLITYLESIDNQSKLEEITKERIHVKQLHSNYSYEDFVAGIQIVNGDTKVIPGYLLKLFEIIKNDNMPHIIILDEINRVDLSRLFGELFSAMENRDKEIDLAVGELKIQVPKNLFFVGTMNQIDFSLERVDFALRRRFAWWPYGYDSEILRAIIKMKNKKEKVVDESQLDSYIQKCNSLNGLICDTEELGVQYEIGHTFFAEIYDISLKFIEVQGKKVDILDVDGPLKVLWDISIEPMLDAFLGNMDNKTKIDKIADFNKLFIGND
jgi:5-methylcytosine-specific restriction enzyme B